METEGSSKDRRKFRRLVNSVGQALVQSEEDRPARAPEQLSTSNKSPDSKLLDFWTSTPLWSGITMLLGVLFTHVSVLLAYFAAWLLIVFEFFRVGFFDKPYKKILGTAIFALVIAVVLFGIWKATPKATEPPTLDQEVAKLLQEFPWMKSAAPPAQQITNIFNPPSPGVSLLPPMADLQIPRLAHAGLYNVDITNIGGQVARQESASHDSVVAVPSRDVEDNLFKELVKGARAEGITRADLTVNLGRIVIPIQVIMSPQDSADVAAEKKGIYLGIVTRYGDSAGRHYYTEGCWLMLASSELPAACIGHNKTYIGP